MQEQFLEVQESLKRGERTFAKPEGIDRRYQSVKNIHRPPYQRRTDVNEANIKPEVGGSI